MITFLGIQLSYEAAAFLLLFIASEFLAVSPWKDNSLVQFILRIALLVKPMRREDDKLEKIRQTLRQ